MEDKDIELPKGSEPLQVETNFTSQWLKNLKRHIFNGADQTISTNRLDRSSR